MVLVSFFFNSGILVNRCVANDMHIAAACQTQIIRALVFTLAPLGQLCKEQNINMHSLHTVRIHRLRKSTLHVIRINKSVVDNLCLTKTNLLYLDIHLSIFKKHSTFNPDINWFFHNIYPDTFIRMPLKRKWMHILTYELYRAISFGTDTAWFSVVVIKLPVRYNSVK